MSAQTPNYALLERARVMIFAAHGATVEIRNKPADTWVKFTTPPSWNWMASEYRISPNWLKVPEGYELVPLGEAVEGPCVSRGTGPVWCQQNKNYNTNPWQYVARPIAKPEPRKVPLSKEDWDNELIWWVRKGGGHEMVTGIYDDGIWTRGYVLYEQILKEGWERSPNRCEWTPCWKLEGE